MKKDKKKIIIITLSLILLVAVGTCGLLFVKLREAKSDNDYLQTVIEELSSKDDNSESDDNIGVLTRKFLESRDEIGWWLITGPEYNYAAVYSCADEGCALIRVDNPNAEIDTSITEADLLLKWYGDDSVTHIYSILPDGELQSFK